MSVEVKAVYFGPREDGTYWVNVKNAHPTGKLGDAGVIRRFKTKEEAKEYTKSVNATGVDTFVHQQPEEPIKFVRHAGDEFVSSQK